MKQHLLISLFILAFIGFNGSTGLAQTGNYLPEEKVASDFKTLLQRPAVDFKPSFQSVATDSVLIEKGFIYAEETEKVPVLIYKPVKTSLHAFPVVICLHGTGGSKDNDDIKNLLYQLTKSGFMAVAIDARYHGERVKGGADGAKQYVEAITKAWENSDSSRQEHPFYFDTVYDLWRLTEYLITRPDIAKDRIGMMGISMGGIETWLAASADKRIKVTVSVIAAQSFKWSLENNSWQGRVNTVRGVHDQAAKDRGDSVINKENVRLVWAKLIPGITGEFDCPSMLRLFAPRPLLLLNNERDPNCPLEGAKVAFEAATNAYQSKNAADKLKIHVTPNEPHRFLPEHFQMAMEWFKKWL